jgi:hypothetical protein
VNDVPNVAGLGLRAAKLCPAILPVTANRPGVLRVLGGAENLHLLGKRLVPQAYGASLRTRLAGNLALEWLGSNEGDALIARCNEAVTPSLQPSLGLHRGVSIDSAVSAVRFQTTRQPDRCRSDPIQVKFKPHTALSIVSVAKKKDPNLEFGSPS